MTTDQVIASASGTPPRPPRQPRKPLPRLRDTLLRVVGISMAVAAVLFGMLYIQMSAGNDPALGSKKVAQVSRPVVIHKVIKRKTVIHKIPRKITSSPGTSASNGNQGSYTAAAPAQSYTPPQQSYTPPAPAAAPTPTPAPAPAAPVVSKAS